MRRNLATVFAVLALGPVLVHAQSESGAKGSAKGLGVRQEAGSPARTDAVLAARRRAAEYKKYETATTALAEKLAGFLPAPSAGLILRMPWDKKDFNEVSLEGSRYDTSADAKQNWRFDEPALVRQANAAGKNHSWAEQYETQDRARWVNIRIRGNEGISPFHLDEYGKMDPPPAGTVRGFPLYRLAESSTNNYGTTEHVFLGVLVGPAMVFPGGGPRNLSEKFKIIMVLAELASRTETLAADEAITRRMLEKIDYDGLKKLLQP